jgi:hypothetical protein
LNFPLQSTFTILFLVKQWVKLAEITDVPEEIASSFFNAKIEREDKNESNLGGG